VTRRNDQFCTGLFDLIGFIFTVSKAFLIIGHCPGTAACSAAKVVEGTVDHFHHIFTALGGNPSGSFAFMIAERHIGLSYVVARIMDGGELGVFGFVKLNPSGFNVFF
jgi:hypothetical protein